MDFEFIEDEEVRSKAIKAHKAQLEEINKSLAAKIEEEVAGLKAKNEELLGEKKQVQEKLAEFADIKDPEAARRAMEFLEQSDEARMIQEGKFDELLEKRTSNMRIEHDKAVKEINEKYEEVSGKSRHYQTLYEDKMRDDELRAVATRAGVRLEAITDVLLRGAQLFALGKDGSIEARDAKGSLLKNDAGAVVTPTVWIEGLKESSPHYWPQTEGAGARGGSPSSDGDIMEQLGAALRANDMNKYRELRAKVGKG